MEQCVETCVEQFIEAYHKMSNTAVGNLALENPLALENRFKCSADSRKF